MYSNCTECPAHSIQHDPDPNDWFCDDDVKVVCKHTGQNITVSCRPTNIVRECEIPTWCPLLKMDGKNE